MPATAVHPVAAVLTGFNRASAEQRGQQVTPLPFTATLNEPHAIPITPSNDGPDVP